MVQVIVLITFSTVKPAEVVSIRNNITVPKPRLVYHVVLFAYSVPGSYLTVVLVLLWYVQFRQPEQNRHLHMLLTVTCAYCAGRRVQVLVDNVTKHGKLRSISFQFSSTHIEPRCNGYRNARHSGPIQSRHSQAHINCRPLLLL